MDQELVQRFDALDLQLRGLNQQFEGVGQRFDRVDQLLDRVEQRLDGHDQHFLSLDQRFDEVKRHTGVLIKGLRQELQLVAEGVLTHIDVRHAEERAYADQQSREIHALFRLSHDSTEQLSQRVEILERKQQN